MTDTVLFVHLALQEASPAERAAAMRASVTISCDPDKTWWVGGW